MERKNRHSWKPVKGSLKRNHKECIHCHLQKWFNFAYGKLIYQNTQGNVYHKTPSCSHVANTTRYKKFIVTPYYN